MKIKCRPEDFAVEELTSVTPSSGNFAFYRLSKESIGTPEAVEAICRRWDIARQRLSFGGMKDRHATTQQYLTIHRGPRRDLHHTNFDLEYLGQSPRAFDPTNISGNRFRLVLRDIHAAQSATMLDHVRQIALQGLPNYFDEQRFGSLGESGDFIAQPWCLGNYERALWLALAEENRHDRPDERNEKRILRETWGRWEETKAALARSHRRSVITYLVDHPQDFRRAFALIRVDMRRLYLAAFQSHLWNQLLSLWLREHVEATRLVDVELGGTLVAFWRDLPVNAANQIAELQLPLPTARQQDMQGEIRGLVDRVMTAAGLELRQLRVKYPRDSFFSKGTRAALVRPQNLYASAEDDELYLGRKSITVQMDLARGSYATILIKQLMLGTTPSETINTEDKTD